MNTLYCTQKLIKHIGFSPEQLTKTPSPPTSTFGNWYGNLIQVCKRKVIIFTNEKTLFTVFASGVTKSSHLRVKSALQSHFWHALLSEGIDQSLADRLSSEYNEMEFSTTKNRRILGSMIELAKMYDVHVRYEGGWKHCDDVEITRKINQTPMKLLNYGCAIDMVHDILRS